MLQWPIFYRWAFFMDQEYIRIRGARVNNLKNIDIDIPLGKMSVITGPSGSGKSSLAFHTLYKESKRRLINSFPNAVKFFIDRPSPVDVDEITPVLPTFAMAQINPVVGARSIVADIMGMTSLIQNLYGRFSIPICPNHTIALEEKDSFQLWFETINKESEDRVYLFLKKDDYLRVFPQSFLPSRSYSEALQEVRLFQNEDMYWEILRFKKGKWEAFLKLMEENPILKELNLYFKNNEEGLSILQKSSRWHCPKGDYHLSKTPNPSNFSAYNALGACKECNGHGAKLVWDNTKLWDEAKSVNEGAIILLHFKRLQKFNSSLCTELAKKKISLSTPLHKLPPEFFEYLWKGVGKYPGFDSILEYMEKRRYKSWVRIFLRKIQKEVVCENCKGSRLSKNAHHWSLDDSGQIELVDIWDYSISEWKDYLSKISFKQKEASKLLVKTLRLVETAERIGLGHLKLSRKTKTLSPGEYQRLLMIKHLSFEGAGALFIFDEPSIGLSFQEKKALIGSFHYLIDQGNTVLLVEHDPQLIKASDSQFHLGPGAGHLGGELIDLENQIPLPAVQRTKVGKDKRWIHLKEVQYLDQVYRSFKFPLGEITWVHGESGTGKSSCLVRGIANEYYRDLYNEPLVLEEATCKGLTKNPFEDVILIDSNLNRFTSRSSVGSYTELFPVLRKHFSNLAVSKAMGLVDGHFSSNSELGQCPECEGKGVQIIEMQYLEDIELSCEECSGRGLKRIYSELSDGRQTVWQAYSNPMSQVLPLIKLTPKFQKIYEYLKLLNLDYLSLSRGMNSLSGGERQRLVLLSKLKKKVENSLLVFENISFGLGERELIQLGSFFSELQTMNNTIVLIDSNDFFQKICHYELNFTHQKIIEK